MMYNYGVLGGVYQGFHYFFQILDIVLLLYLVLSWFARGSAPYALLSRFIEPLLAPFRPISMYLIQRGFPFDISILFLYIAIEIVQSLVYRVLGLFM